MEYIESGNGREFKFDSRDQFIGQLGKSVYKPEELPSVLDELNEAVEWQQDTFWMVGDKEDLEAHLGLIGLLRYEVESALTETINATVENEQPTDEQTEEFLAEPEIYPPVSYEELDAFRASLEGKD